MVRGLRSKVTATSLAAGGSATPGASSARTRFRDTWAVTLLRGGPIIALLVLATYLAFVSPHFLTRGNLINVARQVSINVILAVGQTIVITSGGIDLSVGAILALSASFGAVAMTYWSLPMWLGVVIALVVGTFAGFVNGVVITKGRIPDFIATLGMLNTARGIALIVTGGLPVPSHLTATALKAYLPEALIWLGSGSILGVPVAALVAACAAIAGWFVMTHTVLGRSVYAIGGNREAARVSGISIGTSKVLVYSIMGFMCAVAGLTLTGRLNSANALMAEGAEMQAIAAVVIGGTNLFGGEGTITGTVIGAIIMGILANGLNLLNVSAFWQRVIMGMVIVVVVVFDQWRRRTFEKY